MKLFAFLLSLTIWVFSTNCFAQSMQQQGRPLPVLDKTESYPSKKLEFEREVTYVPLETSKDVLLGNDCKLAHVSNEKFLLFGEMRGDVFIFDKNGKILNRFNQKGGLGYTFISHIVYDEKRGDVYLLDHIKRKIFVYSESGALIRSFKTPLNTFLTKIYNFDDNTLLALDEDLNGSGKPIKPYVYMAKNDGKVLGYVNIELKKTTPTRMEGIGKNGASSLIISHSGIPDNCKFGNDFILASKSMDTVYMLKTNKTRIPLFTQTPSVLSEHPTAASVGMITNRFLKICVSSYDLQEAKKAYGKGVRWRPKFRNFILDIESGEFFEDSGRGDFVVFNVDIPKNQCVELIQALTLINDYKKGLLKDEQKELISKLDMGDNPVIKITKFR